MIDLWPDKYSKGNLKAPVTILKEQAYLLGRKTNYGVQPSVERAAISVRNDDSLRYLFLFSRPIRPVYHYHHFSIEHDVELYPVFFYLDEETQKDINLQPKKSNGVLTVKSEEELQLLLSKIFGASETQRIIKKIGSQRNGTSKADHEESSSSFQNPTEAST